jgi:hypothetical protein
MLLGVLLGLAVCEHGAQLCVPRVLLAVMAGRGYKTRKRDEKFQRKMMCD